MGNPAPKHGRLRFRLRTLLLIVAVVACGTYWLARPTLLAHQFLVAINAREHSAAENLFVKDADDERGPFPGRWTTDRQLRKTTVELQTLSLQDVLHLRRRIYVQAPYGAPGEVDSEWSFELSIIAKASGLQVVHFSH